MYLVTPFFVHVISTDHTTTSGTYSTRRWFSPANVSLWTHRSWL